MIVASLAFAYSGFAMLCATTRRQYASRQAFFRTWSVFARWSAKPAILPVLRVVGIALIVMALVYCMASWGITIGISAGWLVLAMAGYLVVLTATYLPSKLIYMALACLLIALLATGIKLS